MNEAPLSAEFGAGAITSSIGLFAALAMLGYFLVGLRSGTTGRAALAASAAGTLWMSALRFRYSDAGLEHQTVATVLATGAEFATLIGWIGICLRVLGVGPEHLRAGGTRTLLLRAFIALIAFATVAFVVALLRGFGSGAVPGQDLLMLVTAIAGLMLLEQILRNTRPDQQWNLKFLVLGLGIVFGFAFVLYADAMLFGAANPSMKAAHGAVMALAAPFLVVASARNRHQKLHMNLSRRLVIRTGSLVLMGAYLLLIGGGGYWLRVYGGSWGDVLTVIFIATSVSLGITLVTSRTLRERFERTLVRNLYEQKHDFRDEWLRVTGALRSDSETELHKRSIATLGEMISAHRGAIWSYQDTGTLVRAADMNTGWSKPLAPESADHVRKTMRNGPLLLDEIEDELDAKGRAVRRSIREIAPEGFIALPLHSGELEYGIAVLTAPETGEDIEWEDLELLTIAGAQIAGFLALQQAEGKLGLHRQVAAFNQMAAFLVHDLKTVVSQLSLMISNADRHKHNPEFVDDMISTTRNAVERIEHLLFQLRERRDAEDRSGPQVAQMPEVLAELDRAHALSPPVPTLQFEPDLPPAAARLRDLVDALGHLINNAREATGPQGRVRVSAACRGEWIEIEVDDDGPGMEQSFVEEHLFTPFRSTKGLAGMGIGSWQAREMIRRHGGDVHVRSTPGRGTTFTVRVAVSTGRSAESENSRSTESPLG